MTGWCKVKIPAEIFQLRDRYFIALEPPYWYLRCPRCNGRWHLPWDARSRTVEALQRLHHHANECASLARQGAP